MIEATSKEITPELKRWIETWKNSLQEVISQYAGQAITVDVSQESLPSLADDVCYTVTSAGAVNGEMSLRLSAASGSILSQMQSREAQPKAADFTAEHMKALEGLLQQIASNAATALAAVAGEVKFQVAASPTLAWSPAATVFFRRTGEAVSSFAIEMQMSVALVTALSATPEAQPPSLPVAQPATAASQPAAAPQPANYERLMDVELEVKLRFGTRLMELRDVLALGPGAVVELDRKLQAPVDLLLEDRVIAQGDVVVVDGRYGLRITEVLDPGTTG